MALVQQDAPTEGECEGQSEERNEKANQVCLGVDRGYADWNSNPVYTRTHAHVRAHTHTCRRAWQQSSLAFDGAVSGPLAREACDSEFEERVAIDVCKCWLGTVRLLRYSTTQSRGAEEVMRALFLTDQSIGYLANGVWMAGEGLPTDFPLA